MRAERFMEIIGAEFYTGVPDSLLRPLCDAVMARYGTDPAHHIIAANEGNCAAIAAGYCLSTGKTAAVYLQNSGIGNIINPAASLLSREVYGIPAVFIVGWRGEPGVKDEPQHVFQGRQTEAMLRAAGIESFVLGPDTGEDEVIRTMGRFRDVLAEGGQCAFIVRKGGLTADNKLEYKNSYSLTRESAIRVILSQSGDDPVISTTGKASRELFELREQAGQSHGRDFLTVGSMGHSSSIALGCAVQRPGERFWCIDGDGAALMHLGALGVIGSIGPRNLIHIVINNCAHESVGGLPTAAKSADLAGAAKACGYGFAVCAETEEELRSALEEAKGRGELSFIEVRCAIGSRPELGRPTETPKEGKAGFMARLSRK